MCESYTNRSAIRGGRRPPLCPRPGSHPVITCDGPTYPTEAANRPFRWTHIEDPGKGLPATIPPAARMMPVESWPSDPVSGSVRERGPQQVFGRVRRRAGRDRMRMGPVELAQAHAVEGDPGIVLRLLQLPGRLAEIHLALAGVVHTHRAAPLALVAGRGIAGATLLVT